MPRIVLDAAAKTHLLDHLKIVHRALMQPLCLDDLALVHEKLFVLCQLCLDSLDGTFNDRFGHHIVRLRIDRQSHLML